MIDTEAAWAAVRLLSATWEPWLVVIPGLLIGLVFGAVPGLSISIAMAVFIPLTLYMDFVPAILFLTAIFTGGGFGAAIPAILMNIPGASSAVATTFDGYPMACRGEHSAALGIALAASTVGTALGYMLLFLFVDPISSWVLQLGPPEMFVVALWGLTLIAALRDRHFGRGLLAGIIGVLLGTIGMSSRGYIRGTFESIYLLDGIPVIPALIGLFAASELFTLLGSGYLVADEERRRLSFRDILGGVRLALRRPLAMIRGSMIGVAIGAVPGVGASVANLVSYTEARRRAEEPNSFGKGNPDGVIASESANSSSEGGSMVTLLALGLPGGAATAVMLGAFMMHNVTGGPRFMADHKDVVYAIIFGNFVQVVLLFAIGLGFVFVASAIVKVPLRFLAPTVMVFSVLGAFSLTGNMVGPVTVFGFAILGYFMRRFDYPVAATVVGILLGGMAEGEFLRTYQLSGGDPLLILSRPITLVLVLLLTASLVYPFVKRLRAVPDVREG